MILVQNRKKKKKSWSWLDLHLFTTSTWPGCAPSLLFIATENMERHVRAVACQHPHVGFSRPNPSSNTPTKHNCWLLAITLSLRSLQWNLSSSWSAQDRTCTENPAAWFLQLHAFVPTERWRGYKAAHGEAPEPCRTLCFSLY